jgi:four helix bundle protein
MAALARTFPAGEKFKLVDQLVRASRSVTANIAEGYGRFHFQENIQYCRQARGSLYEIIDHLTVALDEKYLPLSEYEGCRIEVYALVKKLNGYISYLGKRKVELGTSVK